MPQYQIVGPDGHPSLTTDGGVTARSGAKAIQGAVALLFDDAQWPLPGEDGYDPAPLASFLATLGTGYAANVMGRSPAVRDPAEVAQEEATAADARAAAATATAAFRLRVEDEKLRRTDPVAYAKTMAIRAVNADFDHQAEEARTHGAEDLLGDIEFLRGKALDDVEAMFAAQESAA